MRKIKISYEEGYYGRFRTLKLFVDGVPVGKIKQGQSVEVEVPDGASGICGKMDWAKTKTFSLIDVTENDHVVFKPYFSMNTLRHVGILTLPITIGLA